MKHSEENFAYAVSKYFKFYLPGERGFSENTIASYRDTFKQMLLYCKQLCKIEPDKLKISDFSRDLIVGFLAKLESDGKSISTRNQRLAAIKSFFRFVEYEFPEHLETAHTIIGIRLKKHPEPVVSYLTLDGISELLKQPDTSVRNGYRDMLLMALLYDSGARVSELVNVTVGDIRLETPATILLHGKHDKDRIVPLSKKTAELIANYINLERMATPETKARLLFTNPQKKQLTRTGVTYILQKYANKARTNCKVGIPEKITPHCIRHSKAMHLLQAGVALVYIRDFLGHSQISTTEIYAKADNLSKRKALESSYSPVTEQSSEPLWNEDAALMSFLDNLCKK